MKDKINTADLNSPEHDEEIVHRYNLHAELVGELGLILENEKRISAITVSCIRALLKRARGEA